MHRSLSLSLALSLPYFLPVCMLIVSHSFCFCLTTLLCTPQVIYKKFNTPCPFTDFAFNSTTIGLNVSAMDPGGEPDPACIPKMANLNSQVGFMHVTQSETANVPPLPWQPPTYVIVIFSMLPVTVHNPSMEITLGLKHSVAFKRRSVFCICIKLLIIDCD